MTVFASGLNNPRHLTFGPGGLYVTEAGTGGPAGGNCVTAPGGAGPTTYCEGQTGSVALLRPNHVSTVLSGLPSVIEGDDQEVSGAAAVTFTHGDLAVLFQDTLVNKDGTSSAPAPASTLDGRLIYARPHSQLPSWIIGTNFARFAATHPQSPKKVGGLDETTYDSDPYAIIPYDHGYAIADGAANDVLWLSPWGQIWLLARIPTVPETVPPGILGPNPVTIQAQAVPTSLAVGPNGSLYVSVLRGFPSLPGTAGIYRISPGQKPQLAVTGLTAVTGFAFDRGGLLAVEYNTGGLLAPPTTPGALVQVSRSGAATTLPITGLFSPTGLAIAPDGTVYVSNYGTSPGTSSTPGEVLKITGVG